MLNTSMMVKLGNTDYLKEDLDRQLAEVGVRAAISWGREQETVSSDGGCLLLPCWHHGCGSK